jgi:TetR/AcrR family transcriptional regulator, regulator of biofilm formation and stress response
VWICEDRDTQQAGDPRGGAVPYVEASERARQSVAAARLVMERSGVAGATLRAVASEAGVPLGTLQYVFPTRELLLRAVIEDVVEEIAQVLAGSMPTEGGLANAVRVGLHAFWDSLVTDRVPLQLMQGELLAYSLRTPGLEHLAAWQYERYRSLVADWCRRSAEDAGERVSLPYERLASVLLAGLDGLVLQYVSDPDDARAREDLEAVVEMVVARAGITH